MSSKGRKVVVDSAQRVYDFFTTPGWSVRRILEVLILPSGRWLEPSAGHGSIIEAVTDKSVHWTAVELRCAANLLLARTNIEASIADFLLYATDYERFLKYGILQPFDVTIGNPPYSLAQEFITKAMAISRHVVMILRLNFLESDKRADWLRESKPDVYVLPNRISGTSNGKTDSTAYAWFHWDLTGTKNRPGQYHILKATSAEERRRDYIKHDSTRESVE